MDSIADDLYSNRRNWHYFNFKSGGTKMNEERNNAQTEEKLTDEEVNVYAEDCGASRLNCYTDCFIVSPFLSTQH